MAEFVRKYIVGGEKIRTNNVKNNLNGTTTFVKSASNYIRIQYKNVIKTKTIIVSGHTEGDYRLYDAQSTRQLFMFFY